MNLLRKSEVDHVKRNNLIQNFTSYIDEKGVLISQEGIIIEGAIEQDIYYYDTLPTQMIYLFGYDKEGFAED